MKTIPLTRGYVAMVDDEDYDRVAKFKWRAKISNKKGSSLLLVYAIRHFKIDGKDVGERMHRLIMGVSDRSIKVDHWDHDGLNNQKYNLRKCTYSQNQANERHRGGSSQWRGVSWSKGRQAWEAYIKKNGKRTHLGIFQDECDAATAYNFAAEEMFGEFASYNVPAQEVA